MNILKTSTKTIGEFVFIFLLMLLFENRNFSKVSAEGPPRKIEVSNDKKIIFAHFKQSLELKCPIEVSDTTDTPKLFFDWYKGDVSLYNENGYTITRKGTLKIKSVSKEHAGIYTCELVNGYGFVKTNLTVIVDEPEIENKTFSNQNSASRVNGFPPIIKKRPFTNIIHDLEGQATFHCVSSGQPSPHIFWFKDDQLIHGTDTDILHGRAHSTLRLRHLKKTDAGIYKCIARNIFGEDEVEYTFHVAEPSYPPTIISLEPSRVTIKEGLTAVFWCEVKSKTELKLHIKWFKILNLKEIGDPMNLDDVTLFRSGKTYYRPLNLTDGVKTNGVYKSKLIIQNAVEEDSGIYVCLALNDKGYNAKNGTLTVISTGFMRRENEMNESSETIEIENTNLEHDWSTWNPTLLKKRLLTSKLNPEPSTSTQLSETVVQIVPEKNKKKDVGRRRPAVTQSNQEKFWEEKISYIKLATEHLKKEEERKTKTYELKIAKQTLSIQLLEMQVEEQKLINKLLEEQINKII